VRLALRAARLFDGARVELLERPLLLIEDGRITGVESGEIEPPDGTHLVDLGDVTLLPGLIDVHVHLGFDASPAPAAQMMADDDATLVLRMRLAARRALAAGITTVRDLGDRGYLGIAVREWFRAGLEPGPEIVTAGPPITVTGGHCHFMGGEADGELELRRAVRTRVKRGVDVIKIMATGGEMTPGSNPLLPQYSVAELAAVVQEAHRLGTLVTAHAHGAPGIVAAVDAGVDGLEHCLFRVAGGIDAQQSLIDRIAEQQIAVCPTLGIAPGAVSAAMLAGSPMTRVVEAFAVVLERMHRAGVRLVAGTDAGIFPGKPHDVLPYAVRAMADAGLRNAEALSAATSVAASACNIADRKGTLAVGRDADILAVEGNPMVNLAALHDVRAVFRAGARV
jgi:imidazolonepropionase-like amidohydrolase